MYYRSAKTSYVANKSSRRTTPPRTARALNILFVFAVVALASTFSRPENIFRLTETRLQTQIDVVFNRLRAKRTLTPEDEALRPKLLSKESRLIYFAFGPKAIADCAYCDSADPTSFLIYSLPSILAPHLLNALVFGVATSSMLAGKECARWRGLAAIAAVTLAALDIYFVSTYTVTDNLRATKTSEIDFFYWKMRTYRPLAIAALDLLLAFVIWLSATNRYFVKAPTVKEKLTGLVQGVELMNARMWATGCVRNTTVRSDALTEQTRRYWEHEGDMYEDREVVDAMRAALARVDMQQLGMTADQKAGVVVGALQPPPSPTF